MTFFGPPYKSGAHSDTSDVVNAGLTHTEHHHSDEAHHQHEPHEVSFNMFVPLVVLAGLSFALLVYGVVYRGEFWATRIMLWVRPTIGLNIWSPMHHLQMGKAKLGKNTFTIRMCRE